MVMVLVMRASCHAAEPELADPAAQNGTDRNLEGDFDLVGARGGDGAGEAVRILHIVGAEGDAVYSPVRRLSGEARRERTFGVEAGTHTSQRPYLHR